MQEIWFSIGRFMELTFAWLLVPFRWIPVTLIVLVMSFGALYWLVLQGRYSRRAKEHNELI